MISPQSFRVFGSDRAPFPSSVTARTGVGGGWGSGASQNKCKDACGSSGLPSAAEMTSVCVKGQIVNVLDFAGYMESPLPTFHLFKQFFQPFKKCRLYS